MKTLKIVQAKRNRKPFITDNKKYELLDANIGKYKIKNDLSKVYWENKDTFYYGANEVKYGFKGVFTSGLLLTIPTPIIGYADRQFAIGLILPFCVMGITYDLKPKI